jgi:hypothetical protein
MKTILLTIALFSLNAFAQKQPSVSSQSSGDCSPNILANSGGVQFVCKTAIDEETSRKIVSLLNQILKKENRATATDNINHKLDEILEFLKKGEPRRLTDSQKAVLRDCLKSNPGSFTIEAIGNNQEAYTYASDFSEVFTAAGWKNEQTIPVAIIMIAGGMWSGVRINVHGTWDDATKTASLIAGEPETFGLNCLQAAKFGASAIPWPDMKTGSIRIDVSEHPQ